MPSKRTPRGHRHKARITDEVVKAWHDCDFLALHAALNLTPWHHSPLPSEIDGLGVSPGPAPGYMDLFQVQDWKQAQALQRRLLLACGWPKNCRQIYRDNLAEALQWQRYCKSLVEHPEFGGVGKKLRS